MKDENGQSWIRAVPVDKVGRYMRSCSTFLDGRHPEIAKSIAEKKALDDGIKKSLDAALKEFRGDLPGRGPGPAPPTRTHVPSLRDIRNRISSVKSTRQITKAMKMVAAAKLRRAQDAIIAARPYAQLLDQALGRVAARAAAEGSPPTRCWRRAGPSGRGGGHHLRPRPGRRLQLQHHPPHPALPHRERRPVRADRSSATIGRKGHDFFQARASSTIRKDFAGVHAGAQLREGRGASPHGVRRALPRRRGRRGVPRATTSSRAPSPSSRWWCSSCRSRRPSGGRRRRGRGRLHLRAGPRGAADELVPRHVAMQVWRALLESAAWSTAPA